MNTRHILILIVAVLMPICFSSCREENISVPKTLDPVTYHFDSKLNVIDITVPGGIAWRVTEYPRWTTPDMSGAAGTKLNLYVESNIKPSPREGVMKVELADNTVVEYKILQDYSDPNKENGIVSEASMDMTKGVGMGIDVFQQTTGEKYYYHDTEIINFKKLYQYLDSIGERDAIVDEDRYVSEASTFVGSSTAAIANRLSVEAGLEVGIKGFSLAVSAAFGNNTKSDEFTGYAQKNIRHTIASRYLREGVIRRAVQDMAKSNYRFPDGFSIFDDDFLELITDIKEDTDNRQSHIADLVEFYGTHFVTYAELGCCMDLSFEMHSSQKVSEMSIKAALELSAAKMVSGDVSVDISEQSKSFAKESKMSFRSFGGNNLGTVIPPGTPFEEALKDAIPQDSLESWVKSIRNKVNKQVINVKVIPIYDLMLDESSAEAVKKYIFEEYQIQKVTQPTLMYKIQGFDEAGGDRYYVDLPLVGRRLEYYLEEIPEIPSTGNTPKKKAMVYSGESFGDGMNYDVGFFMGDGENLPGHVRKQRDGTWKYEPFTWLKDFENDKDGDNKEIIKDAVYVDVAGNITIIPKTSIEYISQKWIKDEKCTGSHFQSGPYAAWSLDDIFYAFTPDKVSDCYDWNPGSFTLVGKYEVFGKTTSITEKIKDFNPGCTCKEDNNTGLSVHLQGVVSPHCEVHFLDKNSQMIWSSGKVDTSSKYCTGFEYDENLKFYDSVKFFFHIPTNAEYIAFHCGNYRDVHISTKDGKPFLQHWAAPSLVIIDDNIGKMATPSPRWKK